MTTPDASRRGRANRNKGAAAERAVAGYLRAHGWPDCERAVRTGFNAGGRESADPGDLTGCGLLVVSVKDDEVRERKPASFAKWMTDLDAMAAPLGAVRLLVVRRRGVADVGRWWCWTRLGTLLAVTRTPPPVFAGHAVAGMTDTTPQPVRMELGHVVALLRAYGYGSAS